MEKIFKFSHILFSVLLIVSIICGCNRNNIRTLHQINAFSDSIFTANEPGAAVVILKEGKVFFEKAYGLADIKKQVPLETTSVFGIGSITKQFTAIAILQLAVKNLLSLDDNISIYFPDAPSYYKEIKIKNLLNHTSGIIDLFKIPEWFALWPTDVEPSGLVDLFINKPLLFEPGEKYSYSNSGYVLLGIIVEKVSGKSYADYMNSNIFSPLKMENTYISASRESVPNRVTGYQLTNDGFVEAEYVSPTHFFGGGSILTNTEDMVKWYMGLQSGEIITKEWVDKAMTPTILNNGDTAYYGYGFEMSNLSNMKIIEHGGSTIGCDAYSLWIKNKDIHIIVLSNFLAYPGTGVTNEASARKVAYQLAEILITNGPHI